MSLAAESETLNIGSGECLIINLSDEGRGNVRLLHKARIFSPCRRPSQDIFDFNSLLRGEGIDEIPRRVNTRKVLYVGRVDRCSIALP